MPRVIVCRRDLRDVALSCWQTGFASIRLGQRLRAHRAAISQIIAVSSITGDGQAPVEWLDVSYEELVRDLEGQSRRLIDFLGLEWDPVCLSFHSTRRVVRTAS